MERTERSRAAREYDGDIQVGVSVMNPDGDAPPQIGVRWSDRNDETCHHHAYTAITAMIPSRT